MLDTNVLVSMILFPSEITSNFRRCIEQNHIVFLCDYVLEELRLVTKRKFPKHMASLNRFFNDFPFYFLYTPREWNENEIPEIRDMKDSPILATAVLENIDVFVTGDKDFTSLNIEQPIITTMTDFIHTYLITDEFEGGNWFP